VEKTPTVYDVAAHAGVSIATVSRVFRRPDAVRPATRDLVMASVKALAYVPSGSARGLAARKTGVLGLYFPGLDAIEELDDAEFESSGRVDVIVDRRGIEDVRSPNLYFDEVLRGSELEAWRRGFALMVGVGRSLGPASMEAMVNEIAGRVDGIAVLAESVSDDVLAHVSRRIPVVLIAGPRRGDDFDHVSVSNSEGMRTLTEHLVETHRVTAPEYVAGPMGSPDDTERYEGFSQALVAHGIDPASLTVHRADFSRMRARELARNLVDAGTLPRALVCANDQMALGILDVLADRGIRVPEDVIVTGFDGLDEGRQSTPSLTTIKQPMVDLGRAATRVMASRLADPGQPPISLRLSVQVLLRASSEGAAANPS
jgi:LacI family transcriptional regulator